MNWQHLKAVLWLRWRLQRNQFRRAGTLNLVIYAIIAVCAVFAGIGSLIGSFLIGLFALGDVSPSIVMYVWDGVMAGFLFFWMIGLLTELQRGEVLSLEKFLHLPVSMTGLFLINYLSSWICLSIIVFAPTFLGLSLGLVLSRGPWMLLLLPATLAFLVMVTGLTYQFQGWLASLMSNPRRRRTVIVFVTIGFIAVFQLPNLMNLTGQKFVLGWVEPDHEKSAVREKRIRQLEQSTQGRKATAAEAAELSRLREEDKANDAQVLDKVDQGARFANSVLPPGWLPASAASAAEKTAWPALLGITGMALIGSLSLWRSYKTTLRIYTGQTTSKPRPKKAALVAKPGQAPSAGILDREIPWVSEQAAAIALGGFRSLLRAPEAKMMLLSSAILVIVFGVVFFTRSIQLPALARPFVSVGAMATVLLSMVHIVGNQFGFDRSGFRVFVLCAAPRRDILLGKNLAVAPFALGMDAVMIVIIELVAPLRWDHLLATPFQMISMFLLFCPLANMLSILAPMAIPAGAMRPSHPKFVPILLQMLFSMLLFPMILATTLVPLGLEALLDWMDVVKGVPIYLPSAILACGIVVLVYRMLLNWQGGLLQAREQRILEIVTSKVE